MEVLKFIGIFLILLIVTGGPLVLLGSKLESKDFNKGVCRVCGKKLRHFDTDSQGGRLYTCENFHTLVCVSYPWVDKSFENKES